MTSTPTPGATPSGLRRHLTLAIPADAERISGATDAVLACLSTLDIAEEKSMAIALAVQEALANAVVHGCGNDASKTVHCELSSDGNGRILIVVADPGPGFNFSSPSHPDAQDDYRDHGRGVILIRQLMDEVTFEHGGSTIRMCKY